MDGNLNSNEVSYSSLCCEKDFPSHPQQSGVINNTKNFSWSCNCEFKFGTVSILQEHLLMKHERLSRVKVIPDRYKLKPAVVPKAVEMWITIPSIQSSGRITPPPSLQTLLFILAASTLFTLHERRVFYLLHSLGASNYEINQHKICEKEWISK